MTEENLIEKAKLERKELDEAIAKLEKLEAQRIVGGRADAGKTEKEPVPETPREYKDRIMRGGQ